MAAARWKACKCGRDACYAAIFENVVGTVHRFRGRERGKTKSWRMPAGGSTAIAAVNDYGPQAQFTFESYLTPPTLYATDGKSAPHAIKSQAPVFDASNMAADQAFATSADGTKVPYFLIHPEGQQGSAAHHPVFLWRLRAVAVSHLLE